MDTIRQLLINHTLPEDAVEEICKEIDRLVLEKTTDVLKVQDSFCCPYCLEIISIETRSNTGGKIATTVKCGRCRRNLVVQGRLSLDITRIAEDKTGR